MLFNLNILVFLVNFLTTFLGTRIFKYSLIKIKSGISSPFYIFSLLISILYFIPCVLIQPFLDLQIYLETIEKDSNFIYYGVLANLSSETFLIYASLNLIFATIILVLLPLFKEKFLNFNKLLELKVINKYKKYDSINRQKMFNSISTTLIIPYALIFLFSLSILSIISQYSFSDLWQLRRYIRVFLTLSQGEDNIYFLLIRFLQSLAPVIISIAYFTGNIFQKSIVFILSLSLLFAFLKLPISFFLLFISLLFLRKLIIVRKYSREKIFSVKIIPFFIITLCGSLFAFIYSISSGGGLKFRFIFDSLARFTLTTHSSNLVKFYWWQYNDFQNYNMEGSRFSALYHGIEYDTSVSYMKEITQTLFGEVFGDTASFVSLSFMRGNLGLFLFELVMILLIPIALDFLYRRLNYLFFRMYISVSISYYVFLVIGIDTQTILTYYFYIYSLIFFSLFFLYQKFFKKEI